MLAFIAFLTVFCTFIPWIPASGFHPKFQALYQVLEMPREQENGPILQGAPSDKENWHVYQKIMQGLWVAVGFQRRQGQG